MLFCHKPSIESDEIFLEFLGSILIHSNVNEFMAYNHEKDEEKNTNRRLSAFSMNSCYQPQPRLRRSQFAPPQKSENNFQCGGQRGVGERVSKIISTDRWRPPSTTRFFHSSVRLHCCRLSLFLLIFNDGNKIQVTRFVWLFLACRCRHRGRWWRDRDCMKKMCKKWNNRKTSGEIRKKYEFYI